MKKKRICCFCEKWESGGIESFLFNVLTHMDLERFEIDVVVACLSESVFTEPLKKLGVSFHELNGSQRNLLGNWKRFRELLRERRYDVVHLNIFHGLSLYYAKIAEQEGVPVRIAHSHNTALRKSPTRPLKLWIHKLSCMLWSGVATDLWACSKEAAAFLFTPHFLAQGWTFIPNGIETKRFAFNEAVRKVVRSELGLSDEFVIGHIGRLCQQKNQMFLLNVFAAVQKKQPNSRLLLVGEGELRGELEERVTQLGIAGHVTFYGVSQQVERLLWAMDVFAFPSLFEGLGIVAIEAQAAGLPVLASEYIPKEAACTDSFYTCPLTSGADVWAEELLSFTAKSRNRIQWMKQVGAAGFDISTVAKNIQHFYEGGMINGAR